jgi:hypothetical protein
MSQRILEECLVVNHLTPLSRAANTYDGTGVDASLYTEVTALVSAGAIASTGTLDCKLQESDVVGSGYTDIVGAAITQLTQAGSDSDKCASISVNLCLRSNRKKYIRAELVTANAAAVCAVVLLFTAKNRPVVNSPASKIV